MAVNMTENAANMAAGTVSNLTDMATNAVENAVNGKSYIMSHNL